MMKKLLQYFLGALIAVFFSINTNAQDIPDTLSTSYGRGADAHVSNDDKNGPDDNFGSFKYIMVRNHEVRQRISFLKFDIADNPRFNKANDAYLGFNVEHSGKMADTTLEVSVYGMIDEEGDDWEDSLLTYSNAPGLDYEDLNLYWLLDDKVEYLTWCTFINDSLGWFYTELTDEMDDFVNSDKNGLLTFILVVEEPNGGDELRIYSEEDTAVNKPPILHGGEPTLNIENSFYSGSIMEQNYPNPFKGTTTIKYSMKEANHVELTTYNVLGAKVATLVNEFQHKGEYNLHIDMDKMQLPSGIYYTKIKVGSESQIIKMLNSR